MSSTLKPKSLEVRARHIPEALKAVTGWIMWRYELRGDKWTKPPINEAGKRIDAHDSQNWMDFSTAYQAYQKGGFDGIGFDLNAIPELAGVDLDHVVKGDVIDPEALGIISELGGYAEISPSGEGVRVLGYGRLRRKGRKKGDIEMYDGGRYLTVTGHKLAGGAVDLVDFDEALNRVHDRIWSERPEAPHKARGDTGARATVPDEKLLKKIRSSKQADDFEALFAGGPGGYPSDSEADLAFCNILAFWCGCDHSQMDRIVRASGRFRDKWDEDRGGRTYGEITIQKAVDGCREVYSPSPLSEDRNFLETIKDGLKEEPRKLKDRVVLAALLTLREQDPLEFDLFAEDLKAAGVVKLPTLKKMIDEVARRLEAEKVEEEDPPEEPDEEIKAEAARIISEGRSFEYVTQVWQSRHLGDTRAGKVLVISTGAQSCSNTAGIHVILNGPRGCGKSDILQKAAHLLPQKHLLFGDMSPQAIYYFAQKMPDGAVVAFDDVTFNDTYAAVQKRCTTRFQEGAEHHVVLERGPWTFKTKPRISFWCTSVDRQFDEQLQDRYFAVNIEDSPEHKAAVIEFMKERDAGIDREEEERETRICRAIIRDLKDHLFEVVIPFADRITLLPGVGERGYKIISDMVKAFCAFRYAVRETDDRGRLVATEKDFEDAKALFDDAEGHGEEKYTEAEKRVLRAIIQCAYVATLESLADVTGLSSGRLKDIINGRGRDEQQRHGLLAKCHSLAVERVSETVYYEPEAGKPKSKTTTHNEYRLDRNFALSEVYNSLVYLEPAARDDNVPRRTDDVVGDVKQNDVLREGDVDDVVEEREIENTSDTSRGGTTLAGGVVTSGEKISPSPKKPITTSTTPKRALDNDIEGVNPYVGEASGYVDDVLDTSTSERDLPKKADPPKEGRLPTAEESEVLEDLAGRLLQNWPGLPEMVLWEKARGKLGSRLPLAVVRSWLKVEGYVETGQRLNGASLWNPPTSSGEVAA